MRRLAPLLAAVLAAAAAASPAARPDLEAGVTWVEVRGELDVGHQATLRRAVEGAEERGDRLVLEVDTPGGEVQLAWRLARLLDEASRDGVSTTAWIHDQALSAGALLALACERVLVHPTSSFGGAQVIRLGPAGPTAVSPDEVVEEKFDSTWRSSFRAFAQERGRSPVLAEAMVDPDVVARLVRTGGEERVVDDATWDDLRKTADARLVRTVSPQGSLLTLTAGEAVAYRMAEGVAPHPAAVLEAIGMPGVEPLLVERTRADELAGLLSRLAPVLLVLGVLLGYMELKAPGFGLPGILAVACFAVLLVGRYLVGLADVPHLVLIAVGVVLVGVEVFLFPGTLWFALGGVALVVGGLVWSAVESGAGLEYEMDRRIALDAALRATGAAVAALAGVWLLSRVLPSAPVLSRMVLAPSEPRATAASALPEAERSALLRPGARGRALTALRPTGKVSLDDDPSREHEARSSGPSIEPGAVVRVVEVRAGRLVVEEEPAA